MRATARSGAMRLIRANATGTASGMEPTSVSTKICTVVPNPSSSIPVMVARSMAPLLSHRPGTRRMRAPGSPPRSPSRGGRRHAVRYSSTQLS